MKNLISQFVINASQDPKTAAAVHTWTIGTSATTILGWIPTDIGNFAILVGFIGSGIVIYTNLMQHRIKMKIFKMDLAERERRADRHNKRDDN